MRKQNKRSHKQVMVKAKQGIALSLSLLMCLFSMGTAPAAYAEETTAPAYDHHDSTRDPRPSVTPGESVASYEAESHEQKGAAALLHAMDKISPLRPVDMSARDYLRNHNSRKGAHYMRSLKMKGSKNPLSRVLVSRVTDHDSENADGGDEGGEDSEGDGEDEDGNDNDSDNDNPDDEEGDEDDGEDSGNEDGDDAGDDIDHAEEDDDGAQDSDDEDAEEDGDDEGTDGTDTDADDPDDADDDSDGTDEDVDDPDGEEDDGNEDDDADDDNDDNDPTDTDPNGEDPDDGDEEEPGEDDTDGEDPDVGIPCVMGGDCGGEDDPFPAWVAAMLERSADSLAYIQEMIDELQKMIDELDPIARKARIAARTQMRLWAAMKRVPADPNAGDSYGRDEWKDHKILKHANIMTAKVRAIELLKEGLERYLEAQKQIHAQWEAEAAAENAAFFEGPGEEHFNEKIQDRIDHANDVLDDAQDRRAEFYNHYRTLKRKANAFIARVQAVIDAHNGIWQNWPARKRRLAERVIELFKQFKDQIAALP